MKDRIGDIRNGLQKTKPHEVWQEDISTLCQYLTNRYYDFMMHEPEGWEGFKEVKTEKFVIAEQGKSFVCRNLTKDKDKLFLNVQNGDKISILRIRNISSYATITKALLDAVDKLHAVEASLL
ncbi:MAG: hypothetical protein II999_11805 [Bacteroidaceae bacterium]|nr:hypothetical protein [Bacteroidaceae bacterium]